MLWCLGEDLGGQISQEYSAQLVIFLPPDKISVRSNSSEEGGHLLTCDLRKRMLPEGKMAILRAVSARVCSHMDKSGNRKLAGSRTKEGPGYTLNAYSSVTHLRQ